MKNSLDDWNTYHSLRIYPVAMEPFFLYHPLLRSECLIIIKIPSSCRYPIKYTFITFPSTISIPIFLRGFGIITEIRCILFQKRCWKINTTILLLLLYTSLLTIISYRSILYILEGLQNGFRLR